MTLAASTDLVFKKIVDDICLCSPNQLQAQYSTTCENFRTNLRQSALLLVDAALLPGGQPAAATINQLLDKIYGLHFSKPQPNEAQFDRIGILRDVQGVFENYLIDVEDAHIALADAPEGSDPDAFVRALKTAVRAHPANRHPFYIHYLPERADVRDLRFYLAQETALDPRFDDFIAAMQVGCDPQQKLELAKNYWDEMGNGDARRVHTEMFRLAMIEVGATAEFVSENRMTETLACGNLSSALALNRRFYYRSIGSFAVTEFLFPRRCAQLVAAWTRNDLSSKNGEYHREHIGVDARHASGFFRNVIKPELIKSPMVGRDIYWGAMARMNSSMRYLDRLHERLVSC